VSWGFHERTAAIPDSVIPNLLRLTGTQLLDACCAVRFLILHIAVLAASCFCQSVDDTFGCDSDCHATTRLVATLDTPVLPLTLTWERVHGVMRLVVVELLLAGTLHVAFAFALGALTGVLCGVTALLAAVKVVAPRRHGHMDHLDDSIVKMYQALRLREFLDASKDVCEFTISITATLIRNSCFCTH